MEYEQIVEMMEQLKTELKAAQAELSGMSRRGRIMRKYFPGFIPLDEANIIVGLDPKSRHMATFTHGMVTIHGQGRTKFCLRSEVEAFMKSQLAKKVA